MKIKTKVGVIALAMLALVSCKEKKSSTIIVTKRKAQVTQKSQIHKTGDYSQSTDVEWVGNKYVVESKLVADSSLPLTTDGASRYYDNRVTIRVLRADGTEFFKQSFTKDNFKSYIDQNYIKDGALLGVVFVKAEGNFLHFAASVGNPDKVSDEYVPLAMKVDNFGNVTISKDSRMDTESDSESDIDEGV